MSKKTKKAVEAPKVDAPAQTNEVTPEVAAPVENKVMLTVVRPDKTGGTGSLQVVKAKKEKAEIDPISEKVMEELHGLGLNTVNSIKTLYASGFTRAQIVAAGYNASTVYRQVGEYIKSLEAIAAEKEETKATAEVLAENADFEIVDEDEEIEGND